MSVRGTAAALAVVLGLAVSACTGAAGRESGTPADGTGNTAEPARAAGCGPVRFDDVRGPAPSYVDGPLAEVPNAHALCRGLWLPATGPRFVPQGLVVRGHRAWVSGYNHRGRAAGGDTCRVIVVDLRTGEEIRHQSAIAAVWRPDAPSCQHAGGLALDRHGLWLAQRRKAWLLDPETLVVRRGWNLTGRLRGSYLVADRSGRIGFGGFHGERSRPLHWFDPAVLLEAGRLDVGPEDADETRSGPPDAQGAVWADLGPGPAQVWFTRSTTSCGELWGGQRRRYAFLPGAEGLAVVRGKVWVVSESTAAPYFRRGGRPVVPALAQYELRDLADWEPSSCPATGEG